MRVHLIALLTAVTAQRPTAEPRGVEREVHDALARSSVPALERRWLARTGARASDPGAMLGLGLIRLAVLDRPGAERWLSRVEEDSASSELWKGYARLHRAHSLMVRGSTASADSLLAQGLETVDRVGDPHLAVRLAAALSSYRTLLGNVRDGEQLLRRAEARLAPGDTLGHAHVLCSRVVLATRSGVGDAGAWGDEGARLARSVNDYRTAAVCMQRRGIYHERRGFFEIAFGDLQRSADDARRIGAYDVVAFTQQSRAFIQSRRGEFGDAQRTYLEAVDAARRSGERRAEAWASLGLAGVAASTGDFTHAVAYRDHAATLLAAAGDRTGLANALELRAFIAKRRGDVEQATKFYLEVLASYVEMGFRTQLVSVYRELVTLAQAKRDWTSAQRWLDEADRVAVETSNKSWALDRPFHEAVSALGMGRFAEADSLLGQYVGRASDSVYMTAQAWVRKAEARVGLRDAAGAEEAIRRADRALDAWRDRLSVPALRLAAFQVEQSMGTTLDRVPALVGALARAGRFDAAFAFAERRRARELFDRVLRADVVAGGSLDSTRLRRRHLEAKRAVTVAEVVAALGDSTALVEYVVGDGSEPGILFVVARGVTRTFDLPPTDSIRADIERFASLVSSGAPASALGRRLSDRLLAPAIAALPPSVRRIVIVPDGPLHHLPFDLLQSSTGAWIAERFAISQAPSARLAIALVSRPMSNGGGVVAFGDPVFGGRGASVEAESLRAEFGRNGGLGRLRHSGDEARRVAAFGARSTVFLRERATEAAVKRLPQRVGVLHFATHSLVDDRTIGRSAIALASGGGEDGFLTATEARSLSLEADLVVLSGCRTAGGVVVAGEGVQGLTGPFFEAGARAVIATQWAISDEASVAFVERFYRHLSRGLGVSDALWRTKLESIQAGAPARQWAAFVLVGDWLVRPTLRR